MRILIYFYSVQSIEISLLFNPTGNTSLDLFRFKKKFMCVHGPKLSPPHFDDVKN